MRAQDLLSAQYQQAHVIVEQVIDDCDDDAFRKVVGGNIGSIAAIYAHVVFDEDGWTARTAGQPTVWETGGWAEKTGLETPSPRQTQDWAQSVPEYDRAAFREYAHAVYASTEIYFANASDEDLDTEIDAPGGRQPAGLSIGALGLWHVMSHQGEIAALKGVQGLKGLPF